MQVAGRTAVMVGGASGMALATAEAFVERGGGVAIVDLPTSAGAEQAARLGERVSFHPCDVLDHAAVEQTLAEVVDRHGALHVAVNTAGGGVAERTLGRSGPHSIESFARVVDLNLVATFNLNRLQAMHMNANEPDENGERGVIIDTASVAGLEGQIGQVAYSAAKAGVIGMTLTMARDLGSLGIRVVTIAPSLFATGLTSMVTPEAEERLTKDAAFPRRMGRPEEYALLALSVVENPMLNGTTLRLDGGTRFAAR